MSKNMNTVHIGAWVVDCPFHIDVLPFLACLLIKEGGLLQLQPLTLGFFILDNRAGKTVIFVFRGDF